MNYMSEKHYEVLKEILEEPNNFRSALLASYTPNNGIRIGIRATEGSDDYENFPDWMEFDFNADQAEMIGNALLRWAKDDREN